MMPNWLINQTLAAFDKSRREWIDVLVLDPGNQNAPVYIIKINAKMEVYRSMWDWNDVSEEMKVTR